MSESCWHPQFGPAMEVEKFNGRTGFRMWQVEVGDVLALEGVYEALEGKPDYMNQSEWKVLDRKACAIIRFYLTKEVKYEVMVAKSAKEIMEILEKFYESNSFIERRSLKMQLYSYRMDEKTTSLQEHIDEFNRRVWQLLSDFDVRLSDDDKVAILLNSLPEKYGDLVMGMLYGKDIIVYDQVTKMLLLDENRNAGVAKGQGCGGSSKNFGSRSSRNHEDRECYYCEEMGHIQKYCPKLELKIE